MPTIADILGRIKTPRTTRLFLLALLAALVASRLCHIGILWEGDTLPLAAARQMLFGKILYRDIWYDKPPLVAAFHLLAAGRDGVLLRLVDALYMWLACLIAYAFARDQWSRREGRWAAALLAFFLIFDFPSAVIPVASDLLMLAPHLAALWRASRRRPFWAGVAAGVAFWISPKALIILCVCAVWEFAGASPKSGDGTGQQDYRPSQRHLSNLLALLGGFGAVCAIAIGILAGTGALAAYWDQVWLWGRIYAGSTFVANPLRNGAVRTLDWTAFHIAIAAAAAWFLWKTEDGRWRWIAWLALSFVGVAAGMRFFPRYYFLILPALTLMAARGITLLGRRRDVIVLLLLIPATRFGLSYVVAARSAVWRDTAMDRDSRLVSDQIHKLAGPGATLFVWGYRPEIYVYTGLPAATIYLDSQPLSGVPADRHLTQSVPVETVASSARRVALTDSRPTFIVDGIGMYNPKLVLGSYPELSKWMTNYKEAGRTGGSVIYELRER